MKPYQDINDTTISLPQAQALTHLWRDIYMNTFPGSTSENTFRGFVVPMESIDQLKLRAEQFPDLGINSVRTYICAKQNPEPPNEITLSVILLPAHYDGEIYHDIWEYPNGASAIYNFTRPCPPCCDGQSPLHNG